MKVRIDKLLVERGLVPSRERAQAMVLSGRVLVNEQKVEKAGASVDPEAAIRLLGDDLKYVGRGGLKLEAALRDWKIDLTGRTCMDVGASTGGFTDCMLQHGAAEVIAVDTGYGQIHARLRSDPRVKLLEKTNARYLTQQDIARAGASCRHQLHCHRRFLHLCYTRSPCGAGGDLGADGIFAPRGRHPDQAAI